MEKIKASLGHFSHTSDFQDLGTKKKWKEHYLINNIEHEIPENGFKTIKILCHVCNKEVEIKLLSNENILKKRIIHGCIALCLIIFMIYVYSSISPGNITKLENALLYAAFISIFVCIYQIVIVIAPSAKHAIKMIGNEELVDNKFQLHKIFDEHF